MTTRKRKTFDPSLKLEVVRMIKEQGLSIQNVSESMDIGPTAIFEPGRRTGVSVGGFFGAQAGIYGASQ